jgi:fucose 4-O-acetylase-like acetyltransferase
MSQTPSVDVSKSQRIDSIDSVKGIAIILMVFGHTEQGARHRGLWESMPGVTHGIAFANDFIYSFHMPAFFFLAGLFVEESVRRRGPFWFAVEKVKTVLYPYLLWGAIVGLTEPLTQRFRMAGHADLGSMLNGIITGNTSWFLVSLFLCQVLALIVIRFPHWIQMVLALAGCFIIPYNAVTLFYKPFWFFPFVVAGMWVGRRIERIEATPRLFAWLSFGVLFVAQLLAIASFGASTRWDLVPFGLTGTLMLLFFSCGVLGTTAGAVLRWFGEASLSLFLISPFLQGFGREIVVRVLHTTNPIPYLLIPVFFATTIPALLWHWQNRLHIGWLFHWPL